MKIFKVERANWEKEKNDDHDQDPLTKDLLHIWSWSSESLLLRRRRTMTMAKISSRKPCYTSSLALFKSLCDKRLLRVKTSLQNFPGCFAQLFFSHFEPKPCIMRSFGLHITCFPRSPIPQIQEESSWQHLESYWPNFCPGMVAHVRGDPLSRYTRRATRVAADFPQNPGVFLV